MYYSTTYLSPIGTITLACDDDHLVGLWNEKQKYYGGSILKQMTEKQDAPILNSAIQWLDRYFSGETPAISELQVAPIGSEFHKQVWDILCEIPYGETTTYGEVARKIAAKMGRKSMSSQAIGSAVGRNPISIIIPCHRVVGTSGSLTGYAGGIDKKIKLLELENADMSRLFAPTEWKRKSLF